MRKFSKFLIFAGILCIIAAAAFAYYNQWDASRAGKASASILEEIDAGDFVLTDDAFAPEPVQPHYEETSDVGDDLPTDAPTQGDSAPSFYSGKSYTSSDNGYSVCGMLEIPVLGLRLPIMAEYNLANLRISPCRYTDNGVPSDKLVIAGHNYWQHFGSLGDLVAGDKVIYTPVSGEPIVTEVISRGTIEANDFVSVSKGDWDLALFTCNFSGEMRVLIRCAVVK